MDEANKSLAIRGVELKVGRGRVHATALTDSVVTWLRENEPTARAEFTANRMGYQLILQEYEQPPQLEHWTLLIGDCIHNLRSSLDNLCFALARLKQDPPPYPRRIQFPVFDSAADFDAQAKQSLNQLDAEAASCIAQWQPFHRGSSDLIQRDSLYVLHHLSNQDKHRVPQVVLVAINQRSHQAKMQFASEEDARAYVQGPPQAEIFSGPLAPGSILMRIVGNRTIAMVEGQVGVELVPAIQTLVTWEGVIPVLKALCDHTAQIVAYFRERFFEPV